MIHDTDNDKMVLDKTLLKRQNCTFSYNVLFICSLRTFPHFNNFSKLRYFDLVIFLARPFVDLCELKRVNLNLRQ